MLANPSRTSYKERLDGLLDNVLELLVLLLKHSLQELLHGYDKNTSRL